MSPVTSTKLTPKVRASRNESLMGFLARRLDGQHFSGLPLTLLGLAFIYILILFGGG